MTLEQARELYGLTADDVVYADRIQEVMIANRRCRKQCLKGAYAELDEEYEALQVLYEEAIKIQES